MCALPGKAKPASCCADKPPFLGPPNAAMPACTLWRQLCRPTTPLMLTLTSVDETQASQCLTSATLSCLASAHTDNLTIQTCLILGRTNAVRGVRGEGQPGPRNGKLPPCCMSSWFCSCCAYCGLKPLGCPSCPLPRLGMLPSAMEACGNGSVSGLLAMPCTLKSISGCCTCLAYPEHACHVSEQ